MDKKTIFVYISIIVIGHSQGSGGMTREAAIYYLFFEQ